MNKFLEREKLYYLASPYTHRFKKVEKQRLIEISAIAGLMLLKKIHAIYPISGSANISNEVDLGGAFEYWEELDLLYIKKSDGVIVADMDGWDRSVGVLAEIAYAQSIKKPVYLLNSTLLMEKNILRVKELDVCHILNKIEEMQSLEIA